MGEATLKWGARGEEEGTGQKMFPVVKMFSRYFGPGMDSKFTISLPWDLIRTGTLSSKGVGVGLLSPAACEQRHVLPSVSNRGRRHYHV